MVDLDGGDWLDANRAQWDERVPIHVRSPMYDREPLLAGRGRLFGVEERALGELFPDGLEGVRVLHLQCHFGMDTLALAQRGAEVVGVDFSHAAIVEARSLAAELGVRARFVEANIYDLRHTLPEPESFDLVYTTWGTVGWLPDAGEWARIAAWFLRPGEVFYFADGHPDAFALDVSEEGVPSFFQPYASTEPLVSDDDTDYASDEVLQNTASWEFAHPVSEIVTALLDAGLVIEALREHDEIPWRMYPGLVATDAGWTWPDKHWLPLGLSVVARAPVGPAAPPVLE